MQGCCGCGSDNLNYLYCSLLYPVMYLWLWFLLYHKDKPWFNDDCRLAFDIKQGAHLRWTRDHSRVNWDEFVHYQRRANAVYAQAMHQFSVRSRDVLMNAQCPHKWWSTLCSAHVRVRLFLLLLGRVVVWSVSRSGRKILSAVGPF